MANYFEDNQDLQFYINKEIDWESLVAFTEGELKDSEHFKSTDEAVSFYKDIFNLVGEFSANTIAPKAKEIDATGLSFKDGEVIFPEVLDNIFKQIKELELHGMCLPRELMGMNAPVMAYMINSELMARADVSIMAHHSFHGGIAMALLVYSIMEGTTTVAGTPPKLEKTRFKDVVEEIGRGDAWGSMDITEPDAGSDMAKIRTKAEQDRNGNWLITGQKIFITSGHGKYHIVIAKTENTDESDDFAGLKGLSLFLVPAWEIDKSGKKKWLAKFTGMEHKLGHSGSATITINYEKTPGMLIGQQGEGFKYMLLLMNNARIGVGFECLGLIEAAKRMATSYAKERPSMGKTLDQHEMIADYLEEMDTDAQAIRAMAVYSCFHEEMIHKISVRLLSVDPESAEGKQLLKRQKKHKEKSRKATPLLKYYAAEKAVEHARNNIQIHGGVGYTKEYDAEKLLRDALVFPIYEGTSQIQALMAMKDTLMEVMKKPTEFATRMAKAKTQSVTATDSLKRRVARIQYHSCSAARHLITKVAVGKVKSIKGKPMHAWSESLLKNWNPKTDFAPAMLHAERLTQIMTDEFVCEILLDQTTRHPERRDVLERFLERAEARVQGNYFRITNSGKHLLSRLNKEVSDFTSSQEASL